MKKSQAAYIFPIIVMVFGILAAVSGWNAGWWILGAGAGALVLLIVIAGNATQKKEQDKCMTKKN